METPSLLRVAVLSCALAVAAVWWLQLNYVHLVLVQSLDSQDGKWEMKATAHLVVRDRAQADLLPPESELKTASFDRHHALAARF